MQQTTDNHHHHHHTRDELPQVTEGETRIAVYWDGEDQFFKGTIGMIRPNKKRCWFIVYDDDDQEWINPFQEQYRILTPQEEEQDAVSTTRNNEPPEHASPSSTQSTNTPHKKRIVTNKVFFDDNFCFQDYFQNNLNDDQDWVSKGILISRFKKKKEDYIHIPISEKVKQRQRNRPITSFTTTQQQQHILPTTQSTKRKIHLKIKKDKTHKVVPRKKTTSHKRTTKRSSKIIISSSETLKINLEQERIKRQSAKPLTLQQIQQILGDEDPMMDYHNNYQQQQHQHSTSSSILPTCQQQQQQQPMDHTLLSSNNNHHLWVRRSMRQPSRSALDSSLVQLLIDKLQDNDPDVVVLKMKKYINDPNTPSIVIDAALDALEENRNCQALYIQNFNEGMRDEQLLHLLRILQSPHCRIWCLNVGETYKVKQSTWKQFAQGLAHTQVTHMYASEHTITNQLKDQIRKTIRENRKKHRMHIDPENLDVIVQCTHNWWNPINAKSLQTHIRKRGLDFLLQDKEALGLLGTNSGANLT